MSKRVSVLVSLGSNIEPKENLTAALEQMAAALDVRSASRVYLSRAVAERKVPDFLNAAVEVQTRFSPAELKYGVLRGIEAQLGRRRSADRNAPRPIDLDIALYGDKVIENEALGLRIPDPKILTRRHVVLPLADLSPARLHPLTGEPLSEIAVRLEAAAPEATLRFAPTKGFLKKALR